MVDQRKLAPELVFPGAAEVDVQLEQTLALLRGKDAAALLRGGQPRVGRAEHDQMPDAAPAHAVKVAGRDAVERDRDRADVVFRQHQGEQAAELLGLHGALAEDGGALLERADRDLPQLGSLSGKTFASGGGKRVGARGQKLRQLQVQQQPGQRRGLLGGGMGELCAPRKALQRRGQTAAQRVDAPEAFLRRGVKFRAVAVGVLAPVVLALPGGGAQLPFI